MADRFSNPGQGSGGKGIFQTPFGNSVSGKDPVGGTSNAPLAKPYDYGNACDGFKGAGDSYSEKGGGVIMGPGTATGKEG